MTKNENKTCEKDGMSTPLLRSAIGVNSGVMRCLLFVLIIFGMSAASNAQSNLMGININAENDYDPLKLFADAMLTNRGFEKISGGAASVDANGWPTEDCGVVVWHGISNMHGTYTIQFTGTATISSQFGAITVTNQSVSGGVTTAKINYSNTDGTGLKLTFTNTSGGIKNIKLMRPTAPGSTTSYATSVTFTDYAKTLLNKFTVIRFMDFTSTNGNQVTNWSDRTLTTHASQSRTFGTGVSGDAKGAGVAWEYAIQLANEMDKDMWINIPHKANDNYITQLATLIKNNLEADRKVYVEWSNEVWNTSGGFDQSFQNRDAAIAEVNAGGSPLNYDGNTDSWIWAWRRVGKKIKETSDIFRSVFGDAQMMTRIRPVLAAQVGYADGPLYNQLALLEGYYASRASNPKPVNYYLYAAGGSGYYNPTDDAATVDAVFATMPGSGFETDQSKDVDWATAFGLHRIAYEGGPSLDPKYNAAVDAAREASVSDPRMKDVIINTHNIWSNTGGELLMYYQATGNYSWGFTNDIHNLNTPKLQGIDALNAATRAPITHGAVPPVTIAGSAFNVPASWAGEGNLGNQYGWRSYTFRVTTAGSYTFGLDVSSSAGGSVNLFVDNTSLATISVPNTNGSSQATATYSATLQPGVHAVRVKNMSGSFSVDNVKITTGGATQTLRDPENPTSTTAGLDYKYYEGSWSSLPAFSSLTPVKTGTVANFDITPKNVSDNFAFQYTGYVSVPTDGTYNFYTSSDDGSKLYIGTTQVVDNDGLHASVEKSGSIGLKAGKHSITVTFFEATGGESLSVSYDGPSIAKTTIPSSALFRATTASLGAPTGVSAQGGNAQVTVTWNAVSGATGYQIWSKTGTNAFAQAGTSTTTSFVHTGLTNGTLYSYYVIATNSSSSSAASSTVTATPQGSTLRDPDGPASTTAGLDYKYYEGSWSAMPSFASLTPVKTGTVANFDLTPKNASDNFAFQYTGYVNVPSDGTYTFYTTSDDGSILYIGSTLVVNNDGLHAAVEQSGSIGLKAGKHSITVQFFEATGGESLAVSYAGPSITKASIPASALFRASSASSSNLALNKSGSSSSNESTAMVPANAFDGNASTRWASAYSDPQWIQVDLGATYSINRVVLSWEAAYGTSYSIQVSSDASSWSTIYSTTTGDGGTDDLTGLTGSGRYVRMYGTARATSWGYSIWEMEVYGSSSSSQTGTISRETWSNVAGTAVTDIPLTTAPSSTGTLTSFEIPTDAADNYGTRIRGYIVPSATGAYTFYLAGDDQCQLWLSTDSNSANKTKIAEVTGWTNSREWTKYASQTSVSKTLTAGQRYYVEALHKEGGGGDNLAVGWTGPGISAVTVIPGANLAPYSTSGRIATREPDAFDASSISVYPNPAKNSIHVVVKSSVEEESTIAIISSINQLLTAKKVKLAEGDNDVELDASSIATGVYFVRVQRAHGSAVQKIMIVK